MPYTFFRLKMVNSVFRQVIENIVQGGYVGLISQMSGQYIQQFDQLLVLFVNQRHSNFEIFIPWKNFN